MKKLVVTKSGSEVKGNDWKEDQEISCHETIAELFIKNGWAKEIGSKEIKEVKQTNKKK